MYLESDSENSRPATPSEEDCCHNACDPCIFDIHKKLLEEYYRRKKQNVKIQNKENLLCPYLYKNFVVTNIKEISDGYILLFLKYQENNSSNNKKILIYPGQHVMLHLNDITKPFTPISFTDDSIEFLIRLYLNGKFSTHLRNITVGHQINVRGPYGDLKYECNSFQKIIMFTMGSGITAVYSLANSIVNNELEETRVHLIGGFQNISQIPLKKELQALTDYWNFKCTLYISQLHSNAYDLHGINIQSGRLSNTSVSEVLKDCIANTTLILICGNHEFNNSVKQWAVSMNCMHIYVFE
ncbi:NADH-cytochrome b5 reductase-like isoform X1 [Megachile rotundata]|uniref:NADH-cytochrome b5 reductase-like isoform X1 n=1 Tax=Megachile rotundata TaxID=143995 RepID=UPI003FCF16C3